MLDETYVTGEDYGDGQGTGYNNMLTMAEDNYNYWMSTGDGEVYTLELVSDRSVTVERGDTQVLTLLYNDYSDLGGAHGSLRLYRLTASYADGRAAHSLR